MRTFAYAAKVAFVLATAMAGVIWMTSYLAVTNAGGPRCTGHELTKGFHTRDFFSGISLFAAILLTMMWFMARRGGAMFKKAFEGPGTSAVMLFGLVRTTHEAVSAYCWPLGALSALCFAASLSVTHYLAILNDCPS